MRHHQIAMAKAMGVLIIVQWILILCSVITIHRFFPKREILFTRNLTTDFILFFIIIIALMYMIFKREWFSPIFRVFLFFTMGAMVSYLLGIQTNAALRKSPKPSKTATQLLFAWTLTITILLVVFLLTPVLMPHARILQRMSMYSIIVLGSLFLVFLGIPVDLSAHYLHVFVSISFFVFLLLLFANMVNIMRHCRRPKTVGCDAINGATTLYIDMINIMQNAGIRLVGCR